MRYDRRVEYATSMRVSKKVYSMILIYAKEHDITLKDALTRLVILGACKTEDLKEVAESHEKNTKKTGA